MEYNTNENKLRVKKYLGLENVSVLLGADTSWHLGAPVIRDIPAGLKTICKDDIETYFATGANPSYEDLFNCLQADRFIKEKKGDSIEKITNTKSLIVNTYSLTLVEIKNKMNKLLLIIATLLFSFTSFGQVTEQNLSPLLSFDGEPYMSINPSNHDNIIAGWMRLRLDGKIWIAIRNSFNGGQTWGNYQFLPHVDTSYNSADVSIDFHNSGIAYLSYIDVDWSDTTASVFVTKSMDGGNNWSVPVATFKSSDSPDIPIDRPWIVVDNSGTASDGTVYVSAMTLYDQALPHYLYVKSSIDSGLTWSNTAQVDDSLYPVGQVPVSYGPMGIDKTGKIYLAYYSYEPLLNPFLRLIVASTNDIQTGFNYSVVSNIFLTAGITSYFNGYSLSVSPIDTNVSVAWTDNRYGDNDILLSSSNDQGVSWSIPIRVNDDSINNGIIQDKVWTNFSSDGNLSIMWRDRRNGGIGDTVPADTYAVFSGDNGNSFSQNYKLSTVSAPYAPLPCCNSFASIASTDSTIYGIWGEDRATDWDIYFSKLDVDFSTTIQDENKYHTQLIVYPNPANDNVRIKIPVKQDTELSLSVFNLQGQVILKPANYTVNAIDCEVMINVSAISTGTYIIVMEGIGVFAQKKIMIIK